VRSATAKEAPRVDGRGLDDPAATAIRRMAVARVRQGERPSDVMRRFGLCRTTIYRWLRAEKRGGEAALAVRRPRGRRPIVDVDRAAALARVVVGSTPLEHGLPGAMWTRTTAAALVERRLGVRLHPVSAARLLGRLGLRPNGPALPVSEAARRPSGLAFAVDGRGAFLCVRLEDFATADARLEALRRLALRAGRPTAFRVTAVAGARRAAEL
jgi:transposase